MRRRSGPRARCSQGFPESAGRGTSEAEGEGVEHHLVVGDGEQSGDGVDLLVEVGDARVRAHVLRVLSRPTTVGADGVMKTQPFQHAVR